MPHIKMVELIRSRQKLVPSQKALSPILRIRFLLKKIKRQFLLNPQQEHAT
jgi:hypothetical protein